jgi:three-Cys-motif partner protein
LLFSHSPQFVVCLGLPSPFSGSTVREGRAHSAGIGVITSSDLEAYEGREHAKAKHTLLADYVKRYAMILGRNVKALAFVDGFAGPWKSATEDLSDTSFGLMNNALKSCAEALRARFGKQPTLRALWIESDPVPFEQLAAAAEAATGSRITVEAEQGLFQSKIDRISRFVGDDAHGFIFVDPKGFKDQVEPEVLAPLLKLPRGELLINFMWDHIKLCFGHRDNAKQVANMRRLFGAKTDALFSMPEGADRESACIAAYESELRSHCPEKGRERLRVLSYAILDTHGQQYPKYFLVHTTHSARGLFTFAQECDRITDVQGAIFRVASQQRREERSGGQAEMFGPHVFAQPHVATALTQPWFDLLPAPGAEAKLDVEQWADMLEAARCLPSALQAGARKLIEDGAIEIVNGPRRPRPKNVISIDMKKPDTVRRIK